MSDLWVRFRWGVACLVFALILGACLGQDWLDQPLDLGGPHHGWAANVEPEEEFGVALTANALYPDVPWRLVDYDPSVIEMQGSEQDAFGVRSPADWAPPNTPGKAQHFLAVSLFTFGGVAPGEAPLVFELRVGDELVDVCELTISVVEDACEGDLGLSAPRCRGLDVDPDVNDLGHGWLWAAEPGDTFEVNLPANAIHAGAPWQVVEFDPAVVEVQSVVPDAVRTAGDWDNRDETKPELFLPIWRFTFEAVGVGESSLMFEIRVDGVQLNVHELTLVVAEDSCSVGRGDQIEGGRCD